MQEKFAGNQRQLWINYVISITSITNSKQLWHLVKRAMGIYPDKKISLLKEMKFHLFHQ